MSNPRVLPKHTAEVRAFLERHADTGEPSAEALGRVQQQLLTRAVSGTPAKKRQSQKRGLPPEFLIAAGLLLATLGGRWWFEHLHHADPRPVTPSEIKEPSSADLQAVHDAWRAGDFDRAARLAQQCSLAGCAQARAVLAVAVPRAKRVLELSRVELEHLAALDKTLAQGQPTALGAQIATRLERRGSTAEAEVLYAEAIALRKAQNLDGAVVRLERCVSVAPSHFNCYKLLGSVHAAISVRDSSAQDREKARRYYQRFLELAPPDDEAVPKVRAILEAK